MAGDGWFQRAGAARLRSAARSQPRCRAGTILGIRGSRWGAARATSRRRSADSALDRRRYWTLVGGSGADALISVIETRPGSGATLPTAFSRGTRPGRQQQWAGKEPCMHHPNPDSGPRPPARERPPASAAAAVDGHDRGRQVHLRGAGAGRRGWPPPCAGAGRGGRRGAGMAGRPPSHCRGRVGGHHRHRQARRAGNGDANRDAAGPAEPGRGSGRRHAGEDGRERGRADTQAQWAGPVRRPGRPGGWRVVVELSDSGSGPGGGAGGRGPAGRGGRTGAGRARGGVAPLGLAGLAPVGDRHGPDPVGQP
jgi:hypothetical protein